MTVVWGVVGMLAGVFIAAQLIWPQLNFDLPFLTYSRLRPLHTNAVIFAFGGSALFATAYYVVQRTCHVRLALDKLAAFTFWGWQAIIVLAAITLPLGITQSKEYAELEWPIDILITVVWVAYAVVFFGTVAKRRVKHIYVANWFFGAFILTVAMLHIVNSMALPVSFLKSYSAYAGVQDAMVQWWYGHNAVGFFLTAGFLGIMYYFIPKQAERPVYSYRLSVVHFWALSFTYIWAGPHHLHYTALPDWTQSLGMVFSLILLAPSWGGMINGIMTLSGAWEKLRSDPILKFLIVSVSFYGMSTFEGPMMAIKTVNALSHYTDWTVGHVHSGALGWVAMVSIGAMYFLVPKLFDTEIYSRKLIETHFWIATIGIVLYITSMWISGIMQGLMWRAVSETGGLLYPNFVETYLAIRPMYWARLISGLLYFAGIILMAWNLIATARSGAAVDGEIEVAVVTEPRDREIPWWQLLFGQPVMASIIVMGLLFAMALVDGLMSTVFALAAIMWGVAAIAIAMRNRGNGVPWHSALEGRAGVFTTLVVIGVLVGGVAEQVTKIGGVSLGRNDERTGVVGCAVDFERFLRRLDRDVGTPQLGHHLLDRKAQGCRRGHQVEDHEAEPGVGGHARTALRVFSDFD